MASNFFQRWSSRKLQAREEKTKDVEDVNVAEGHPDNLAKDAVLDPEDVDVSEIASTPHEAFDGGADNAEHLEHSERDDIGNAPISEESALTLDDVVKVTFDSGVTSFMKEGVEKSVKKAALRKLFQSDEFNYISDMDDHTEDFSNIPALSADEVKGLRSWITEVVESVNDALATTSEPLPATVDGIESGLEMPQSLAHYSEPQVIADHPTQDQASTEQSSTEPLIVEQASSDQVVEEEASDATADTPEKRQTVFESSSISTEQEKVTYHNDSASKK